MGDDVWVQTRKLLLPALQMSQMGFDRCRCKRRTKGGSAQDFSVLMQGASDDLIAQRCLVVHRLPEPAHWLRSACW